ncbi:hypothetical protein SKAU_G00032240 [Synaphobranchus kaupii]|uniref:Sema domain-containing protein n=1 Tax=Synaphobranchus kaupii TaxID=118154 RepID=A0A9Q1GF72_SYNKA|nr:hypothetical protein SKAU_G00032240 [Synaphobranchus kaupii]
MKTVARQIVGVYFVGIFVLIPGLWAATMNGYGGWDSMVGQLQFSNVSNFSTFLMDPSTGTLYLGARDAILAVDSSSLRQKHTQIIWNVPEDKQQSCVGKGKTEGDCHNYIRLLEFVADGRIYACGTYAFDPQCAVINMLDFSLERAEDGSVRMETGKGKCPFEPSQHYTAVMADGVLYAATTSNFLGTLFDISRATGSEGERIRTEQSINWLSDPEFVSSSFIKERSDTGDDDKIYFFFTEVAKEYDLYTKVKVSRVARVCKGDVGGMKTLQKRWTTFLKAQLVCEDRASGQRYNILTNVFTKEHRPGDPSSTQFYGIFTSQWEREELSAVCMYSLADINKVMAGSFKELKKNCENWMNPDPIPNPRPGQCITRALKAAGFESSLKLPDKVLTFVRDHPLMENSVVSAPLLVRRGITYTRIAVTLTPTANSDQGSAAVLLLGTDRGELHRVSVVGQNATLLQEVPLFTAQEPVNNILLYQDQALVGSPLSLARVAAEGCGVYPTCEECARAQVLGCKWSLKEGTCTPILIGPLQVESEDALKLCDTGEARCAPVLKELRVVEGLRVLLPCVQVSPRPCHWEYPPDRHTRQHHAHLEVTVTTASLGSYTCYCEEGRRDGPACRRATYTLTLEGPQVGVSVSLAGSRQVVAVYLFCFMAGVVFGGFLLHLFRKRRGIRHAPEKGRDLLPSSDTPQSPSSTSLLSEGVPLTEKRNGTLNGHGGLYSNAGGLKLQESAANLAEELGSTDRMGRLGAGLGARSEEELRSEDETVVERVDERMDAFRGAPLAQCEENSF